MFRWWLFECPRLSHRDKTRQEQCSVASEFMFETFPGDFEHKAGRNGVQLLGSQVIQALTIPSPLSFLAAQAEAATEGGADVRKGEQKCRSVPRGVKVWGGLG